MSTPRPKTPSPSPPPANPTNTPMPPPPSPSPSTTTTPRTPSRATSLTSPSARTPGGTLRACSSHPAAMTIVKVHTAKCTECDKRNKDTMLRCPGCTFQICRPCRDRREKKGRGLFHGAMMSPGGLGTGLGSGTGVVRRKVVGKLGASPSPSPVHALAKDADETMGDVGLEDDGKVKGRKNHAGKKRAVKSKPVLSDDSDDDDDFTPDLASPTARKKRRTTLAITDTPTATSARPSRRALQASTYAAQSSPSASSTAGDVQESTHQRPASLNSEQTKTAWKLERQDAAPTGRLQELLEANGVNTPSNRYDEHFLLRHDPVVTNPVASIPETVRRMAEPVPRLTAEQKVDLKNKAQLMEAAREAHALTVRDVVNMETPKYQNRELSTDENDELASAIKETTRKWALRTYDALPRAVQATVARSLDLRLDYVAEEFKIQLAKTIEECAVRKLSEFEQDRATSTSAWA